MERQVSDAQRADATNVSPFSNEVMAEPKGGRSKELLNQSLKPKSGETGEKGTQAQSQARTDTLPNLFIIGPDGKNSGQDSKVSGLDGKGSRQDRLGSGLDGKNNGLNGKDKLESKDLVSAKRDPFERRLGEQYTFGQATMSIARPIASGAWNEITEHYGRVALSGAVGFGVGFGLSFLSPGVTKYLAVGGLLLTGYELVKSVPTWYKSGKVLADPESSDYSRRKAEQVMKGIGAGSVDLTAGIIGGALGSRVGWNYQMELQKPVRFDSDGRPIKMPLPNDKGFAHVKYDKDGRVSELVERYNDFKTPKGNVQQGWREIIRSYEKPSAGHEYYTYGHDGYLESQKGPWLGKFSYDKSGLTMVDETGITQLRTNGASTIVRTADQAAKMQAAKAAFAQEYKTAAEAVRRLSQEGALSAGAAGMAGIAAIVR